VCSSDERMWGVQWAEWLYCTVMAVDGSHIANFAG
jgi:hypothetical protein